MRRRLSVPESCGGGAPPRRRLAIESLEERRLLDADALLGLDIFRTDARFAGIDGSSYSVVVIDHGADLDHPFFGPDADNNGVADRIIFQQDFGDNDADASETISTGHGTAVTSIIGSQDATHPGVAPGVDLIVLKLFGDGETDATYQQLQSALQWVEAHAAQYNIVAVNLSIADNSQNYSSPQSEPTVSDEFARLAGMGIVVVAAAGNGYAANGSVAGVSYPAADPNVIAVSSVWADNYGSQSFSGGVNNLTSADHIAAYSQRHPTLTDIFAPGGLITAAASGGGVNSLRRGTSYAAPFVTGAAVLAQQLAEQELGRRLTVAEFRDQLQNTGVLVNDGDNEDDNVLNTGADYRRLNILALAESLLVNPGPPTISIFDSTVNEPDSGTTLAEVVVQLSRAPNVPVTVDFDTADGTATLADNDFASTAGTLTFLPTGPLTQTILVPVVGDFRNEGTETFRVVLSNPGNAVLADATGVVTILDNDRLLPWRNPDNPHDVNDSGTVTGLDALIIINRLNDTGPERLPDTPPSGPYFFYDVSGDGRVTGIDALMVINELNRRTAGQASASIDEASDSAAAAVEPATPMVESASELPLTVVEGLTPCDPARLLDEAPESVRQAALGSDTALIAAGEVSARRARSSEGASAVWQLFWAEYDFESNRLRRRASL
jgi:hypothetical protein